MADMKELDAIQNSKRKIKSFFTSKDHKVNKITELSENMQRLEKDMECLDMLFRIVVLQLNNGAINFFKKEKFATYNRTINAFAVTQLEVCFAKRELLQKMQGLNQTDKTAEETKQQEDPADVSLHGAALLKNLFSKGSAA